MDAAGEELDLDLDDFPLGGDGSSSSSTSIPANSTNKEIMEEVLDVIDEALMKSSGKGGRPITLNQLKAHAKGENNIIIFRDKDGNLHEVSLYKEWVPITELDPKTGKYIVTDYKLNKQEVIGEPVTKKPKKSKTRSFSFSGWKDTGSWLRYLFPQSSWALNVINWLPSRQLKNGKNILSPKIKQKKRMSVWGSPKKAKFAKNTAELLGRGGVEQFLLMTLVGNINHIRRGDSLTVEPEKNFPDWINSPVFNSQPINMLVWGILEIIERVDVWDGLREDCKVGCENDGIEPGDVLESKCYKKCEEKVNKLKDSFYNAQDVVSDWAAIVTSLEELEDYGPKKMKKWCEEGEKKEMVSKLLKAKEGLNSMKKQYDKFVKDNPKSATLIKFMSDMFPNLSEGIFGKGEDAVKISTIDEKINDINIYCDDIENGEYKDQLPGNTGEGNTGEGNDEENYETEVDGDEGDFEYDDDGLSVLEIKVTVTPVTFTA